MAQLVKHFLCKHELRFQHICNMPALEEVEPASPSQQVLGSVRVKK